MLNFGVPQSANIPLALTTVLPQNLSPGSESQVVDDPLLCKNTEATLWLL